MGKGTNLERKSNECYVKRQDKSPVFYLLNLIKKGHFRPIISKFFSCCLPYSFHFVTGQLLFFLFFICFPFYFFINCSIKNVLFNKIRKHRKTLCKYRRYFSKRRSFSDTLPAIEIRGSIV